MKLWKITGWVSQINYAQRRARRLLIRICRQHSFLIWAFLPLSILSGFTFEINLICDLEQLNWLREIIRRWVENGSIENGSMDEGIEQYRIKQHFSEQSFLRLISSIKLSQGVSFALIVASAALIFVSSTITWRRSLPQQRKGTFAVLFFIATTGIVVHSSGNPCLSQWYFDYWYSPIELLNPLSNVTANILIVVSNIAMALLVVAVATFHQDHSFLTDQKERLSFISAELTDIRRLLYFASSQLTIGAYALFYGLYVNMAGINGEDRKLLLELVANLTFVYSATYSLLLFAIFYPSFSQIRKHAYRLHESAHLRCLLMNFFPKPVLM